MGEIPAWLQALIDAECENAPDLGVGTNAESYEIGVGHGMITLHNRLAPLVEALERLGNAYEEAPLSDCQGELEDVLEAFMALKEGK
jgi:hypothetical protein